MLNQHLPTINVIATEYYGCSDVRPWPQLYSKAINDTAVIMYCRNAPVTWVENKGQIQAILSFHLDDGKVPIWLAWAWRKKVSLVDEQHVN